MLVDYVILRYVNTNTLKIVNKLKSATLTIIALVREQITIINLILVKYKIYIRDKQPPFRLLYNLLENKLAVLY